MALEVTLQLSQRLDLVEEWTHARHFVGIDQVILEDGESLGILDPVVLTVLLLEKVVHLGGRELVGVPAVDPHHHRVPWRDMARTAGSVPGEDLLGHGHRSWARLGHRNLQLSGRHRRGEGEQPTALDDQPGDRIVVSAELLERNALSLLESPQDIVPRHQNTLIDVVGRMDRRERGGDRDADAAPLLRLDRRLSGAADTLTETGNDDLEATRDQRITFEESLAVDDQAGVGLPGQVLWAMIEADPGRRHGVGVDVVEEVLDRHVGHRQIELPGELAPNQVGVLGEEQDALTGGDSDPLRGPHRSPPCFRQRGLDVEHMGAFYRLSRVEPDRVARRATVSYAHSDGALARAFHAPRTTGRLRYDQPTE